MNDEDTRVLFEEPQILAVAIFVALLVVAILMIPCFYISRRRETRVLAGVGASMFAIAAVVYGDLAFTRWALYDGGHGRSPGTAPLKDWLVFAAINAVLAIVGSIPGGVLGLAIGLLIERRHRRRTGANKSPIEPSDAASP